MKIVFSCLFLIGILSPAGAITLADDAPTTQTATEKPSDDTIREFHLAVAAGDMRLATKMISIYPDLISAPLPDDDPAKQVAPLLTAVVNGQGKRVAMLLNKGASYHVGTPGKTPIFSAAMLGHTEIIKVLLDAGANVDGIDDSATAAGLSNLKVCTPLREALSCGRIETARLLVSRGAKIDIFSAAGLGWNGWVAKQLKEHPERSTMIDDWNYTPLTYAVACGCAGTAEALLKNGADHNRVFDDHGTFLHMAAVNGSSDLMLVLLAHGADVNLKNDKGETPLDYAEKYKQQDVAQILRDHGGTNG